MPCSEGTPDSANRLREHIESTQTLNNRPVAQNSIRKIIKRYFRKQDVKLPDLPPVPHHLVLPHLAPVHAEYNVTTLFPSPDESCNTIVLTGQLANVAKAKQAISHYVEEPQDKKLEQGYLKKELVSQQNEPIISSLQKQILELSSQWRNLMEKVKSKMFLK